MTAVPHLEDVHGASVWIDTECVGTVTEVFADAAAEHLVGLEIRAAEGNRWFLPWAAATVSAGVVVASSPLVFISAAQLEFYVRKGLRLPLEDLRGLSVDGDGRVQRAREGGGGVLAGAGEGISTV